MDDTEQQFDPCGGSGRLPCVAVTGPRCPDCASPVPDEPQTSHIGRGIVASGPALEGPDA